jgi:putative ABC transport system permease protein
MLRFLPLVFKNTLRNRRRSILTISSIAASMCLLGVLFALYRALFLSDPTPEQALRLFTYHRVSLTQALPASYADRIRSVPGVREAAIMQWFGGVYRDARDTRNFFARFSVDSKRLLRIRPDYRLPEDQKQAFFANRTAAIASRELADKFKWPIGERITLVGDIFPVTLELTLAGIYDDPDREEMLLFHHEYLRESMSGSRQDMVGSFLVQAESADVVPRVVTAIDKMFENAPAPTKTETEQAFALSFVSFLGNVKMFLLSICAAVTFTILLVSANTMAMTVRERIREVGILKTLGFTNRTILWLILGEAGLIAVIGGAFGLLLANGIAYLLRQGPPFLQQIKTLNISPEVTVFCLIFSVFVGVASSLIPAANAARTNILDSLRSTG